MCDRGSGRISWNRRSDDRRKDDDIIPIEEVARGDRILDLFLWLARQLSGDNNLQLV
jgi:hypothetical protein